MLLEKWITLRKKTSFRLCFIVLTKINSSLLMIVNCLGVLGGFATMWHAESYSQTGIKPMPVHWKCSFNQWTARESLNVSLKSIYLFKKLEKWLSVLAKADFLEIWAVEGIILKERPKEFCKMWITYTLQKGKKKKKRERRKFVENMRQD